MKTINYLPAVIAIIFNCTTLQRSSAQGLQDKALADSLLNVLSTTKSDTDKATLLSKVARVLTPFDPTQALSYANQVVDISKKANWAKGIGLGYMNRATIYVTISDYVAGLQNAEEAYKIFKSLNWKPAMANALVEISNGYENLGDYSKAIENNFKALAKI